MMRSAWLLALVCGAAWAQEGEPDTLRVTGQRLEQGELIAPEVPATGVHLGDALEALPGIWMVRRGADAADPVLRGLSGDRVQTRVGIVPVHAACPSRMDPPVTYLSPGSSGGARVEMGVPSVTLGGGATGGRIVAPVDYAHPAQAAPEARLRLRYDAARAGGAGEGEVRAGLGDLDLRLVGGYEALDDYTAADGTTIPARRAAAHGAASLGYDLSKRLRVFSAVTYARERDIDTPALPMDIDSSDLLVLNLGVQHRRSKGVMRSLDLELGAALVDHVMSNAEKPNVGVMEARTPATADTYAGALRAGLRPLGDLRLDAGLDFQRLERDATRTRYMVAMDKTFEDHIWPEASQQDLGGFLDARLPLTPRLRLEAGARLDLVASRAGAAGEIGMGGQKTITEHYVSYYGEAAREVDRDELLGGARLAARYQLTDAWGAHLALGLTRSAADTNARYFAFAPAPGGFQIGDPSLDPESRWSLDLGVDGGNRWIELRAGAYLYLVEDLVSRRIIDRKDVNGDGVDDRVFGFRNITARLYGGEVAATIKPVAHLSLPLSAGYVRGEDLDDDADLPEMPPLDLRGAARIDFEGAAPWWAEVGARHVTEQTRVDEQLGEDETPAFTVVHLRAGVGWGAHARLELGVENLLDEAYHEHLTREALLPVGGLEAGDEISAPGRRFYAALKGRY